jgi:hypothetical protein
MSEHEGKTGVADARRLDTNFTNTHEWNEAFEFVEFVSTVLFI